MTIAIAHDYLTQRGGAERVVLSMMRAFPDATLHTSLYDPAGCFPEYRSARICTSRLNAAPALRRRHRLAFPLLARTFSTMRIDADVTLVSSSGWAHGVRTSGRKIVYCHAPARWLYQRDRYLLGRGSTARAALRALEPRLRAWDLEAAATADWYIANSTMIRDQVRDVYGVDAEVLHPPVNIDVSGPRAPVHGVPQGFVLCIARLQAYKNVDVVIDAMRRLPEAHLVVVGTGPLEAALRGRAGRNVTLVGEVTDAQLRWLYLSATVLVGAAYEDFGLTPIEAAAFGIPTIAYRAGGYLDTVSDSSTGLFFDRLDDHTVTAALRDGLERTWSREVITKHADDFGEQRFISRLRELAGLPMAASLA